MSDTDNPLDGGTAMSQPSDALTNPNDIYAGDLDLGFDDEDNTPQDAAAGSEPKSETIEEAPEADQENEETAPEPEGQTQAPTLTDDTEVEVNGEKLKFSELKAGYMRQADQSRKGFENSQYRKALVETATRIDRFSNELTAIVGEWENQIQDPDIALMSTDFQKYMQQKAMADLRRQNLAQIVQRVSAAIQGTNEIKGKLSQDALNEAIKQLDDDLSSNFEAAKSPAGLKMVKDTAEKAAVSLGYLKEDVAKVTDARMWQAFYYVQKGMEAERAAKSAQAKATPTPVQSVRKAKAVHPNSLRALDNVNAEKRFRANPTSANAALTDFDHYS